LQQGAIAYDHSNGVVEVVGYSTGQAADRLHFLRLHELPFQKLALGDVLVHAFIANYGTVLNNGAGVGRDPHRASVLAIEFDLKVPHFTLPFNQGFELFTATGIDVDLMSKVLDTRNELFGRVIAEHACDGRISAEVSALGCALEDSEDGFLEDTPILLLQAPFRLAQRFLGRDLSMFGVVEPRGWKPDQGDEKHDQGANQASKGQKRIIQGELAIDTDGSQKHWGYESDR